MNFRTRGLVLTAGTILGLLPVAGHAVPARSVGRAATQSGSPKPAPSAKAPLKTPAKPAAKGPVAVKPLTPGAAGGLPPQFKALTQLSGGLGVVICEPVGQNADEDTLAFGAACGRWLQMVVGGQGELGRTPRWSDIGKARWEMKRTDLRLNATQAPWLAQATGATHVAVGRIEGNGVSCTLTYQLLAMPGNKPVGEPLVQTGSREQVLKALPGMARQFALRLNVPQPHIPDLADAKEADFIVIGRAPWAWQEGAPYSSADKVKLLELSERNVLAGMLCLFHFIPASERVRRLMEQAGDNVVVASAAADMAGERLAPYGEQIVDLQARYPHNYQLAMAHSLIQSAGADAIVARQQTELAIQCSRANPQAWLALGTILGNQADSTRRSRLATNMSEADQKKVFDLYPLQEAALRESARLDPQNNRVWKDLSVAAAFNGNGNLADYGIQKSLQLRPDDAATYWWAFQVYQPKWFDDTDKLFKVASLAAANDNVLYSMAPSVLNALQDNSPPGSSAKTQTVFLQACARLIPTLDVFAATTRTPDIKPPDITMSQSPGLLVCEPTTAQSDEVTAAFGAGCGRWLQFNAGGQTELGQTPLWHAIDEARRRLKRPDLRLDLAQGATAARWLNASHVAVGKISGNDARCTLTYQLYAVPPLARSYIAPLAYDPTELRDKPASPKAVGAPLTLTGSKAEVLATLPSLARQLATRLGVENPRVPATVELKAEELGALGQLPWLIHQPLLPENAQILRDLMGRSPLAALLALSQAVPVGRDASLWQPQRLKVEDPELLHSASGELLRKAGDNPLAWGQVAWFAPQEITPVQEQLAAKAQGTPRNYPLLASRAWWLRSQYNFKEALGTAWQAARCNSHYGGAWLELAGLLDDDAMQLQEGRMTGQMTPLLQGVVGRMRALQYQAARMALRFDPQNSRALLVESRGAANSNLGDESRRAMWYAIALEPDNAAAYSWGFQVLQPKWGGEPEDLDRLLQQVAKHKGLFERLSADIYEAIQTRQDAPTPMREVTERARAAMDELVATHQQDTANQLTLTRVLARLQPEQADKAYQNWVRLTPNDPDARFLFGNFLLRKQNQDADGAATQFREAVRLNPHNPTAVLSLVAILRAKNQDQEAEPLIQRDLKIEPDNAYAHLYLGQVLANQQKKDEARSHLEAAIAYDLGNNADGSAAKTARELLKSLSG